MMNTRPTQAMNAHDEYTPNTGNEHDEHGDGNTQHLLVFRVDLPLFHDKDCKGRGDEGEGHDDEQDGGEGDGGRDVVLLRVCERKRLGADGDSGIFARGPRKQGVVN